MTKSHFLLGPPKGVLRVRHGGWHRSGKVCVGLIRRESNENGVNGEKIKMGIEEGKSMGTSKGTQTQEQSGKSWSTIINSETMGSARSWPSCWLQSPHRADGWCQQLATVASKWCLGNCPKSWSRTQAPAILRLCSLWLSFQFPFSTSASTRKKRVWNIMAFKGCACHPSLLLPSR